MQLDRTEIAIRPRTAPELLDLSLQVLKRHWQPILLSMAIVGAPLMLLDACLIAWMLASDTWLAIDQFDEPATAMRWRHAMHWIALFVAQFPLISLPTSIYLGQQMFFDPIPLRALLRRLWSIAGRSLWVLGCLRLGLLGLVSEVFVYRSISFNWLVEFWLIFVGSAAALLLRSGRPFAPEILGLELCPWRPNRAGEISYRQRSSNLHRYLYSEHFGRFLAAAIYACLLWSAILAAQWFAIGVSTGDWRWNYWLDYVGVPLSLWCVGLFMAIFRFLAYIDSRLKLEGWEVELRLKAEAARLEPPPHEVTPAQSSSPPAEGAQSLPEALRPTAHP